LTMFRIEDFYTQYGKPLELELFSGKEGLIKKIRKPEVQRPGLSLAGHLKNFTSARIFVFGKNEIEYLREMTSECRKERLSKIFTEDTPAVIVARRYRPPSELAAICRKLHIPLFRSKMNTMALIGKIILLLNDTFSPSVLLHGTLVEVFGVGVLIQGESSVGKSEAALSLLDGGHRLIADDVVRIKKKEGNFLIGEGPKLTRHMMEIRGIGIINVAQLYGAVCVRLDKTIELVVKLELWDEHHFYDRVGLEEKFYDILGVQVPFHVLPLKPGRDVKLLIETICLNHRLKASGYHSAKEFNRKLLEKILSKEKKSTRIGKDNKQDRD